MQRHDALEKKIVAAQGEAHSGSRWLKFAVNINIFLAYITMRKNLPKTLDQLTFSIYSLNFSLEFFMMMIKIITNQLNISKFLPPQRRKTLHSY